jgi:hypothetical protein
LCELRPHVADIEWRGLNGALARLHERDVVQFGRTLEVLR